MRPNISPRATSKVRPASATVASNLFATPVKRCTGVGAHGSTISTSTGMPCFSTPAALSTLTLMR